MAFLVASAAAALAVASMLSVPQSVASPVRPVSPICGATTIAKSTGGYWQCTFADEFSGTTVDTGKWIAQQTANSGYHSGAECFVNSPNNISVAGGTLRLTVRAEAAPFTCTDPYGDYPTQYTSGMVSTYGRFTQAYGRFEVRAMLPAATVAGLQEAFWLWPANGTKYGAWPASGEIDIAEGYSLFPDRAVPYIHYNAAVDTNVTNNFCMISGIANFHTYAVEWTPTAITVIYDGQTCLVDNWNPALPLVKPQPFDQPFMIVLTQALGVGGNAFDPATTPLPATTQVDYVHIWK